MAQNEKEKPYVFSDLKQAMLERNHWEERLAEINRQILVEENKLKSLRVEEADTAAKLAAEEQKVLRIATSIQRSRDN